MSKERQGVILYFETEPAINSLSDQDAGKLFKAIMNYSKYGVLPDFDTDVLSMAWSFIQPKIDKDAERYQDKCKKSQYAAYCRVEQDNNRAPQSFEDWEQSIDITDINCNRRMRV